MSGNPLKCYWCGRFIAYDDVHDYQKAGCTALEPDYVLVCGKCHCGTVTVKEPIHTRRKRRREPSKIT